MQEIRRSSFEIEAAHIFVLAFIVFCALGAAVIGMFPLQLSIVTIFLFAGPHNLMEFRYFAARMPIKWGRSRTYYSFGIGGVVVLAVAYLWLYFASGNWLWSLDSWAIFAAIWNTAFVFWVGGLVYLRGRRVHRERVVPAVFFLAALAWMAPRYWSLSLVYLHPLIAMWFLERQIRRTKPEWLRAYHYCLAAVPIFVVLLWVSLAGTPALFRGNESVLADRAARGKRHFAGYL